MSPANFKIGSMLFKNQTEANKLIGPIVKACPQGGVTMEGDIILRELILLDDRTLDLIGARPFDLKIDHVQNGPHVDIYSGHEHVVRFGWRGVIKRKSKQSRVRAAARSLIVGQRPPRSASLACECCGESFGEATMNGARLDQDIGHWDHHPYSFKALFAEWLRVISYFGPDENDFEPTKVSLGIESLDRDWQAFHARFAKMRLICTPCNLRKKDGEHEYFDRKWYRMTVATEQFVTHGFSSQDDIRSKLSPQGLLKIAPHADCRLSLIFEKKSDYDAALVILATSLSQDAWGDVTQYGQETFDTIKDHSESAWDALRSEHWCDYWVSHR